jgi:hypothetical protein
VAESGQYVDARALGLVIASERDGLDAVALCGEHDTQSLLLSEQSLAPEFFVLANGLAGAAMQKWMNYGLRVAFVVADPGVYGTRVVELAREHARHPQLRFFRDRDSVVNWLASG